MMTTASSAEWKSRTTTHVRLDSLLPTLRIFIFILVQPWTAGQTAVSQPSLDDMYELCATSVNAGYSFLTSCVETGVGTPPFACMPVLPQDLYTSARFTEQGPPTHHHHHPHSQCPFIPISFVLWNFLYLLSRCILVPAVKVFLRIISWSSFPFASLFSLHSILYLGHCNRTS